MMTQCLFKLGTCLHPGIYFMGENSIVRQSTNNKVIFLLVKVISDEKSSIVTFTTKKESFVTQTY